MDENETIYHDAGETLMHKFTQTNKSPRSKFCGVRVYDSEGVRVVEYELNQRSPLEYLRKRNGKHRKAFIEQCLAAGVQQNEIDEVLNAQ